MKIFNKGIIIILTGLLLAGCHAPGSRQESLGKTVFRYNELAGITSLDPAFARNVENIRACQHLYNGLVEMDEQLNIVPSIATDWDISEDGKVYTFFLRRDVYFHDHPLFPGGKGRKVTAIDFVSSFYRLIDSKLASPGAWIFNRVDMGEGERHLGFEALDKYTLRIYLKEPFAPFLGLLTMKYCSVVPMELIEHYGYDFRKNPVGTGPFKFKTWNEGTKLVLVKNPKYFEKDIDGLPLPYIDAVAIRFIKDEDVEYQEFLLKKLDVLSGTNASNNELLNNQGELKEKYQGKIMLKTQPYLNTEYLGFFVDKEKVTKEENPLLIKEVRQAIAYGFSRKNMIRYLKNNIGTPATAGFIPKGFPSFDPESVRGYEYRPDTALKLLADAGFPNGQGLPVLKLYTTSPYLTLCEYIQHQLQELGIRVKLEVNPAATNRELIAMGKINFFRKSWVADYPDAENYFALFYSKNFSPQGPNYTHFSHSAYDALYERAQKEVNEEKRYDLYREMDRLIIEEAPVVPLYYDEVVRYIQPNVIGLGTNPVNIFDLRQVEIFPENQAIQ